MEVWKACLRHILDEGQEFLDSNNRISREVLDLKATIRFPERDVEQPIGLLSQSEEWIYPSPEEIGSIIMAKRLSPAYTYSYGPRLFNFRNTLNQIDDYVIPLLKFDKSSRRATVMVWDPLEDGNIYNKLVPGVITVHFKVKDNKLNASSVVRSNDFFFGWPANNFQIFTLLQYLSQKLDIPTAGLTTFSISAHIFKDEYEHIEKALQA